jgi:non-specific protein-tyrosine kinase
VLPKTAAERRNGHDGPVVSRSPRSAAAEAYRTLRTNLQFSGLDRQLKTILITSGGDGDGKTTVVANLGVAMAESGKRVLLVDCDLRRPGLHESFGLSVAPGLSNALLADSGSLPVSTTSVPGLSVLTAGDLPPNPAEFVASARLSALLARVREEYDYVLLDSPPAGLVADAVVLAPSVDGVVMVVSAGRTKRDAARRAKEQLERVGARLIGVVLNNAKQDRKLREYHSRAR